MMDFERTRAAFLIPENLVYLDGNSLGPLPRAVAARSAAVIGEEWGNMLIRGWLQADWVNLPGRVGNRIARIIGARAGTVTMGDTLSIKVFQALSACLQQRLGRGVVLSDSGNFPTDLYMAQGLIAHLGRGHALKVVEPESVADHLDDTVAALMLTHVDYRTGRLHDMAGLSRKAHAVGALALWDLAHSAGAMELDLDGSGADFAVGCTYKYLNGGPGAPAFIYVRPELAEVVDPILAGWMGHEAPFAFDPAYRPAPGIARMRVGTPPVVALSILETALEIWDQVDMGALRARSVALCERFISGVEALGSGMRLVSPRDGAERGSQVSFAFEHGYAATQALIAEGVVGDFRAPNVMRFGFAPLYISFADVDRAVETLARILRDQAYLRPEFQTRAAVT